MQFKTLRPTQGSSSLITILIYAPVPAKIIGFLSCWWYCSEFFWPCFALQKRSDCTRIGTFRMTRKSIFPSDLKFYRLRVMVLLLTFPEGRLRLLPIVWSTLEDCLLPLGLNEPCRPPLETDFSSSTFGSHCKVLLTSSSDNTRHCPSCKPFKVKSLPIATRFSCMTPDPMLWNMRRTWRFFPSEIVVDTRVDL